MSDSTFDKHMEKLRNARLAPMGTRAEVPLLDEGKPAVIHLIWDNQGFQTDQG